MDFLKSYNVVQLAVGVVIGSAVKDLVAAIIDSLVMPLVGILTPTGSWQNLILTIAGSEFKIGNLISSALNFFVIAMIVFFVIKKLLRLEIGEKKDAGAKKN